MPHFNLIFNVEGIPVAKSSNKQCWPIVCKPHFKEYSVSPFPVAIYFGNTKPSWIEQFIEEFNHLIENGLRYNEVVYGVSVLCFTCDAPPRSFHKNVTSHNACGACERCIEKGVYYNKRITYQEHNLPLRTHNDFVKLMYPEHHREIGTPLLRIHGIDVIEDFCLDYMLLVQKRCFRGKEGVIARKAAHSCLQKTPFIFPNLFRLILLANYVP